MCCKGKEYNNVVDLYFDIGIEAQTNEKLVVM